MDIDMKELTLSAVKKHLNIDIAEDDDYLAQLIQVVLNLVIKRLNLTPVNEGIYESDICLYRDETASTKCLLKQTVENCRCPILCPYRKFGKLLYEPALYHGMLLLIGNLYANREPITEGTISKIPYTLDYLLEPYKNYKIC